ncbi:MAG: S41 family peptidase [Chloroflexota bacterium]
MQNFSSEQPPSQEQQPENQNTVNQNRVNEGRQQSFYTQQLSAIPNEGMAPSRLQGIMQQPLLLGCVVAFLLVSTFLIGLGLGFGAARLTGPSSASIGVGGILAGVSSDGAGGELQSDFGVFWEAMDLLYGDFFGELPENNEATYGAIRGVLNQLEDPNTSFMTPEEAEFFSTNIQGSFEGIGARVAWDDLADAVRITEPFENQPAWTAGLRRDDLILAVDGESLAGSNITDAVMLIRGEKGSTVVLTIFREGEDGPFDVEVVRDRIEIPTIATETLGDNQEIGYVRLNSFNENAGTLVKEAIEEAVDSGSKALIFDLRGNTGGLLREAVKVASVFLENQVVLLERFSDGRLREYETEGNAVDGDLPMVVLVNGGSASASEIVAGAIQDANRAPLMGTTTFGKGSVQLPHRLSDGSIMRVTIARWYTPEDRSIDKTGLEPDILIELSEEEREAGDDPQLDAAVEHLIEQLAQ